METWTVWAPGDGYGWRFELHERVTGGVAVEAEVVVEPEGRSWLIWNLSDTGAVVALVPSALA